MGECSRCIILSRVQMSIIRRQLEALPAAGIGPLPGACLCFLFSIKGRQSLETETDNGLEIDAYSIKLGS